MEREGNNVHTKWIKKKFHTTTPALSASLLTFSMVQTLISTAAEWCDGAFMLRGPVNKSHINKTVFHPLWVT